MLSVAAGSGYWRENAPRLKRYVLYFWFVPVPLATALFGYFPGRRLRKIGDLPAGGGDAVAQVVPEPALQRGRRRRRVVRQPIRQCHGFRFMRSRSLDDELMTLRGTHSLVDLYENAPSEIRRIGPAELGVRRVGHFGPFRSECEATLWPRMEQWLASVVDARRSMSSPTSRRTRVTDEESRAVQPSSTSQPVALVVGAGDATGGAIARRFARGGYTVCATRRNRDKLAAAAGAASRPRAASRTVSAPTPARKTRSSRWSSRSKRRSARSRCWCSTSAPTRPAASWTRPRASTSRSGRWPASPASSTAARWRGAWWRAQARPQGHDHLHRRHGLAARLRQLRGLRRRQARVAGAGAEHGARTRAARHPRAPT